MSRTRDKKNYGTVSMTPAGGPTPLDPEWSGNLRGGLSDSGTWFQADGDTNMEALGPVGWILEFQDNGEQVEVTDVDDDLLTGGATLTVVRGVNDTTATSHAIGTEVVRIA